MCGIAGVITKEVANKSVAVSKMLAKLKHRGPDASSVIEFAGCVLGHNRLSIIDLNSCSDQPFVSNSGRYAMVFNGEIYNYQELRKELKADYNFKTHSDTEVLLAAYEKWGVACVHRLIGMFSFAIWDGVEHKLFCARDRFGVKPFYYARNNGDFLFASEIKALWEAGISKNMNARVWSSFYVHGTYGTPAETFWDRIEQLPPGHYLVVREGEIHCKKWYQFESRIEQLRREWADSTEEAVMSRYFQLLRESIRLRFRADVPVGFNVSGGLDSSLLLSMIKEAFPDDRSISAFTFYTGNEQYDELPWVEELIATTNYPLHKVLLQAGDVPDLAKKVAVMQDEPYGGIPTLAYSQLFKNARSGNTIVLLDGQGIDEAWAGYDYYQGNSGSIVQGVQNSPMRASVLEQDFIALAENTNFPEPFKNRLLDTQYRDLFYTKIPRALRFNDRVSMMYSTELREPFLDHRLVEMAFSLPSHFKINGSIGKYLLRKHGQRLLSDKIRLAPKRALQTPQREWLANELMPWADEHIRSFANQPGVNRKAVVKEWEHYCKNGGDNSFFVWQWINANLLNEK